jgi:hypothetical protein
MGKKFKKSKVDQHSSTNPIIPGSTGFQGNDSNSLIAFDKKTRIFILILISCFFILSLLKIHTSNIANWEPLFGLGESESVIAGKPRFIRMDEWMVATPNAISQYELGLPVKNESIGDKNTPFVWGLPVKDISTILRPAMWSYFIFDIERAFAFSWNFNIFFFLISFFLLLMLLTKNNFWLSVTGTLFIFFSGGIQWWSYIISNYMLYLNGMFISFVYILYHKKPGPLIAAGLVLILSVYGFIFSLYPPFQIPLVYLYSFLFVGFLLKQKKFSSIREKGLLKIVVLSISIIILAAFTFHYYNLVKDTYSAILNTVYPGKRFSTGGGLIKGKFFAEFFEMFMTDINMPRVWMNICEASGFIMFFPIVFYGMAYIYYKTRKIDPQATAVSLFIIIGIIYIQFGFPAFVSKVSLFSMSPSERFLPILGVGNAILLICHIGNKESEKIKAQFSWIEFLILSLAIFTFIRYTSNRINSVTENFFTSDQVNIVSLLILIAYLLIRYKDFKYAKPALYILLVGLTINNISVNPITKGLSSILENPLVRISKEIHDKDPKARWALFGNTRITHLLKANGINLFNTVKMIPIKKDMEVLDPKGISDSTYNRYAWMGLVMYINRRDTVIFQKGGNDSYNIYMDPCSPKFNILAVRYFVFTYVPQQVEIRCMTKVGETNGIFIYKRNPE